MKIYIARHGDYQNPEGIVPGRSAGYPLTELGIKQAETIAHKLSDVKVRAIYTSPIERTLETATIISRALHLFPNPKPELMEVITPYQGYKISSIPSGLYTDPFHLNGGGETREALFARVNAFVETLKSTSQNSTYLLVFHGDPIHVFLTTTLKQEIRYIPMGGLVLLEYGKNKIPTYTEII